MASIPAQLKPINHFLKCAEEHDTRDPVVAYWCRFHAVQTGLSIDKSSMEAKKFLFGVLDILENAKKANADNEAITNEQVAEAHVENYAFKIFNWADGQDRSAIFNKNVVKSFYKAGVLFDVLSNFTPDGSEEIEKVKKYAKWRAAYIHNCLKNGETPIPGNKDEDFDDGLNEGYSGMNSGQNVNEPGAGPSGASYGGASSYGGAHFDGNQHNFAPYPSQPGGSPFIPQQFISSPQNPQDYSSTPFVVPKQEPVNANETSQNIPLDSITKAQKYCKTATSALNFDDVPTALTNLKKAIFLLEGGIE